MVMFTKAQGLLWGAALLFGAVEICATETCSPPQSTQPPSASQPLTADNSDARRLAALRSMLFWGKRNEGTFGSIMRLFKEWPPSDTRQRALKEANTKLRRWPDEVRINTAYTEGGEIADQAALVRHVVLLGAEEHGDRMIRLISGSPYLADVTHLTIRRCEMDTAPLARSKHLTSLTYLRISKTLVSRREQKELFASKPLAGLTNLQLHDVGLHDMEEMLGASFAPRLTHLTLTRAGLGDSSADAFVSATHMKRLKVLDLRDNFFSERGKAQIRAARHLRRTKVLF